MDQPRTRSIRSIVGIVALCMVVSASTAAVANHSFPDVPNSSAFHDQIEHIVDAGCATGFDDGTFRPLAAPNRGQFAAWMNRCGGRVMPQAVSSATITTSGAGAGVEIAEAPITAGATGTAAANGFVLVQASVVARTTNPTACPCFVQAVLVDLDTDDEVGSNSFSTVPQGATDVNGEGFTTIPVEAVVPIEPDQTRRFGVRAFYVDANVGTMTFDARITGIYAPFGPTGGDQLTGG
jgi:hypothetical protein